LIMVDLNRKIRATQARQGGFSSHVLPGPVGYQVAGTFIFAPQRIGDQWKLMDGTPVSYWTATALGAAAPASEFRAAGGPGGRNAVRHSPYLWGGLHTQENPKFSAPPGTIGITIDGWVFFAPVTSANTASFSTAWGLSRKQTTNYLFDFEGSTPAPSVYLEVSWEVIPGNTPPGGRVSMRLNYRSEGGGGGGSGARFVLSATENQLTTGWHHYAVEYATNGEFVLYFDGQPVSNGSGTTVSPDLSQMQVMHGSWVRVQQNTAVAPPDYADMSYLRCRYQLPYGGQPFTP
jgi:hypothetical protein